MRVQKRLVATGVSNFGVGEHGAGFGRGEVVESVFVDLDVRQSLPAQGSHHGHWNGVGTIIGLEGKAFQQ